MQSEFFESLKLSYKEGNKEQIKKLATRIIEQLRATNGLRQRAIYHPLGFIYTKLYEFKNKESIRLHLWDKERWYQKPLMDIHDHYYTVNSFVFKGCIRNNLYKLRDGEPNFTLYKGQYSPNGDRVLTKTDKSVYASLDHSEIICEGNLYQITTHQLHSSFVETNVATCTLVYTENPGIPNPLVLGPYNGNDEYYYSNYIVEDHIVDGIIEKLLN
jgi:hypothetical protein